MYPDAFKEELSSGFSRDTFLAGGQNGQFREAIHNHKHTFIPMLGWRQS
jgi:hypothetical protein